MIRLNQLTIITQMIESNKSIRPYLEIFDFVDLFLALLESIKLIQSYQSLEVN